MYKIVCACFLLFSILSCSSGDNNPPAEEENTAPVLLTTNPASNATVPVTTKAVDFIFDRNIGNLDRPKITLNSEPVTEVSRVEKILTVSLGTLKEKTNYTVALKKGAVQAIPGTVNQEEITLAFSTGEAPGVTPTLVTPNPSVQAQKLYDYLRENYGKKIISGTMANVAWNINEAEWVHTHTGKYPALNGFDYIHLYASPANWINYENTQVVEDWWNANGLVTASWHWNVPKSEGSTDYAFYTAENSFDIREALKEGTWQNRVIKADLDKIADNLLLLQKKNIPVLWRPLHEAAGGWFWWGAKGAEPCKALWKLMFDAFRAKGLNNLIWAWTAEPGDDAWYPGDNYVDIIGRDIYNKTSASSVLSDYAGLKDRYPGKIITLSECGNVAQISAQWSAEVTWSWFMPWYDYERTNDLNSTAFNGETHQHANIVWWKNAMNQKFVVSRDLLPNLK